MDKRLLYYIILACIVLELISPLPAFLTFGSLIVLFAKPRWFKQFIDWLYAENT